MRKKPSNLHGRLIRTPSPKKANKCPRTSAIVVTMYPTVPERVQGMDLLRQSVKVSRNPLSKMYLWSLVDSEQMTDTILPFTPRLSKTPDTKPSE
jgi:hypothetical protein